MTSFVHAAIVASEAHRDTPAPVWIYPTVAGVIFLLMLGFTFTHRHVGKRHGEQMRIDAEKASAALESGAQTSVQRRVISDH